MAVLMVYLMAVLMAEMSVETTAVLMESMKVALLAGY